MREGGGADNMKPITDIEIGQRAAAEALRLYKMPAEAARRLRIGKTTFYSWKDGTAPGALHLAKLHYAGADVIYILTGKRSGSRKDGAEWAPKKM